MASQSDMETKLDVSAEEELALGQTRTPLRRSVRLAALYLVATVFLVITALPYFYMVVQSVAPWDEVNRTFVPSSLTFRSYTWIYTGGQIGTPKPWLRSLFNSLFVTLTDTVTRIAIGALAGYALAVLAFRGQKRLNDFVLFHMFYPAIILLVPTFLVVRNLQLYNTYGGMIIPLLVQTWAVYMYTSYFRSIPQALIDAARIDGAGNLRILWNIMLPMSASMSTVIFLFLFMQRWIVLMWDLIVVKDPAKQTLNVLLQTMFGPYGNYPGPLYAGSVLLTFPILILFSLFSRRFVEGIHFTVK